MSEASSTRAKWRPIETAPKNRDVLISTASGHVYKAVWAENISGKGGWRIAAVWAGEQGLLCALVLPDEVTHWMPLPAPPTATLGDAP
jgi:hypothetical protein